MKRYSLALTLSLVFGAACLAADKPNIVVFLTDDQGYGDLGCMGSETIKTPHIDSLAKDGMKFTSFYVHQRCSPTRLAFMTGSHADRAGYNKVIYWHSQIGINEDEVTVAELLKSAGYRTGIVGKWHLGEHQMSNPLNHGFDSFFGFMEYEQKKQAIYKDREVHEKIKGKTDGVHSPKLLEAGISFIKENRDQPFFLYYASPLPHVKWLPNERFAGKSAHGTYGDVVEEIDWQFGGLMKTLDDLGLRDNTLVIFASDNGPQLGMDGSGSAGPLRDGKWTNFEGGIRVPCLMRWPKVIPAGTANHKITGIIDLLPTFCEMAGVEAPQDRVIDGRSILPYMKGDAKAEVHDSFVAVGGTIRVGKWKLLMKDMRPGGQERGWGDRKSSSAGSLFDLETDVGETIDVSKSFPEVAAKLRQRYELAMKDIRENSREIGKTANYSDAKPPKKNKKQKKAKNK